MSEGVEKVFASKSSVYITQAAKQHFKSYISKETGALGVRLSLKKTGCSGLSYHFECVAKPSATDIVVPLLEDYVFCIEKSAYPMIKGLSIDYIREGMNYKLIYKNPNQTGECGCGESFTINEIN